MEKSKSVLRFGMYLVSLLGLDGLLVFLGAWSFEFSPISPENLIINIFIAGFLAIVDYTTN